MKSQRSALLGLALGVAVLGLTACETKDEIVIPPDIDPITVNLVPEALQLEVGTTGQLVAVVLGGPEGTARTVTFTSSNDAVATVDASGIVTAVAPGVATITARATADTNAADASAVTVVPAGGDVGPTTISIQRIEHDDQQVVINDVFGQIDVTLNVDPSPPPGSVIATLTDGTEVCTQTISSGAAGVAVNAEELGVEAQPIEIVCSFDTGAFDESGVASFPNGPHELSAEVRGPDGTVVATVETNLIFNNQSFISVEANSSRLQETSVASPRSVDANGSLWHSGDLVFTLLPVIYTGDDGQLANATVNITTEGFGVTGLAGCVPTADALTDPTIAQDDGGVGPAVDPDAGGPLTATTALPGCGPAGSSQEVDVDGPGPFTVTFPEDDDLSDGGVEGVEDVLALVEVVSVTSGGQAGPVCINPDPAANPQRACGTGTGATANNEAYFENPVRVDNLYPRLTQLSIERAPNQYFGPNVFELDHAPNGTAPLCGAPCARSVDYGSGGQAEDDAASEFLAGEPDGFVPVTSGGAELAESGTSDDFVFGLTTVDRTGNSLTAWATPTTTTVTDDAEDADNERFGWDATNPEFEFASGPENMDVNPGTGWVVSFVDAATPPAGPSGFLTNPVRVKLEHFSSSNTDNPICRNPDSPGTQAAVTPGVNCTTAGVGTGFFADDGSFPLAPTDLWDGYYQTTVFVEDAAANAPASEVVWFLDDQIAPQFTGGIVVPSTVNGGAATAANVDITENVDLGSLIPYVDFASAAVGFTQQVLGGSFSPTTLLGESNGAYSIPAFPRSWEATDASGVPSDAPEMATHIEYNVRDMAGHQLRFGVTPWPAAPNDGLCPAFGAPNTGTQNCSNRQTDISVNVLAGVGGTPFTTSLYPDLIALFADAGNPNVADAPGDRGFVWGSFRVPPAAATPEVCNNTPLDDCPVGTPTSVTLSAVSQGPVGSFENPFVAVDFYYVHPVEGRLEHIGTTSVGVTDETVESTRTFTYTATWNATNLKVRPATAAGTAYTVVAVGRNADGDLLGTVGTPFTVTVFGN